MRTAARFGVKAEIFRNLWCVRTGKGGLSQCGQGGGVNFPRKFFMYNAEATTQNTELQLCVGVV